MSRRRNISNLLRLETEVEHFKLLSPKGSNFANIPEIICFFSLVTHTETFVNLSFNLYILFYKRTRCSGKNLRQTYLLQFKHFSLNSEATSNQKLTIIQFSDLLLCILSISKDSLYVKFGGYNLRISQGRHVLIS